MTTTTCILVTDPVRPGELFDEARRLLGTDSPFTHSRDGLVTGTDHTYQVNPFYANERGCGVAGWLVVRYGADGLLQRDLDQVNDPSLADGDHTYQPDGFAKLEFEVAGQPDAAATEALFSGLREWLGERGIGWHMYSDTPRNQCWTSREEFAAAEAA